jgi:myosin-5
VTCANIFAFFQQATKLLQLKKATLNDIEIIQDICWMLSPNQIQKLLNQYLVADYEQPINGEIMKAVASRVTEKSDVLLLTAVDMEDSGPYEIAEPRAITALETYTPSCELANFPFKYLFCWNGYYLKRMTRCAQRGSGIGPLHPNEASWHLRRKFANHVSRTGLQTPRLKRLAEIVSAQAIAQQEKMEYETPNGHENEENGLQGLAIQEVEGV